MFVVNEDNSIYATRGDIVFFSVTAEDNGVKYTFKAGDVLRIKVYGKKNAEDVVLQKDFPVTENTEMVEIFLTEEDTKIGEVISKPKDYWYEVELNPLSNPQTIIGYDEDGAKVFKLFPEGDDIPEYIPNPEDFAVMDDELDMTSTRPVENQAVARAVVSIKALAEETAAGLAVEKARFDNLISEDDSKVSQNLEYLYYITENTRAKIDASVNSDGVFATVKVNLREANLIYGGTNMDVFIIPDKCRPIETGLIHTADGMEYRINYVDGRYVLNLRAQDDVTVAPSGAGTVTMTYKLGDYELKDIRVGADGKIYPTAGDAVREQFETMKAASAFVTPQMYGAVGDGVADDTEAVQKAISENNTIMLDRTYLVTDTIVIDSGKGYGVDGKTVYGTGTLIICANKDCLIVKGVGNHISGLTIKYHRDFYDENALVVSYDSALLSVVSEASRPANNNRFENLSLTPPYNDFNKPQHQMATGIKILCCEGAFVYNNIFTDCKCYGMDTAVKIVHEGDDAGVNANKFDVSAWCCDCYVDGFINGCVISGNCQTRNRKANGCLFRNFTGMNNVIDSYFFDARFMGDTSRHAVIDEAECGTSVLYNTFTAPISGSAVLNYAAVNRYNFLTSDNLNFYTPYYRASRLLIHRMMPYGNALQQCTKAMSFDQGDGTVSAIVTRYPTYDSSEKTLTDCYALCSDTVAAREIYLFGTTETTMKISFTIGAATRLDAIYLEHQNIIEASCTIDGQPLTTVSNPHVIAFINETVLTGTEVVIIFKVNSPKTGLLKRISAVGYDTNCGSY